jgi:hypothetical protein
MALTQFAITKALATDKPLKLTDGDGQRFGVMPRLPRRIGGPADNRPAIARC